AALEIDAAIAVGVHAALKKIAGQELHLSDLARPRPDHLISGHVAAIDNLKRSKYLRAEFFRAAAVESERRERSDGAEFPHIAAEIGFESPEGSNHRRRYPIVLLDLAENGGVFLDERRTDGHAVR